MLTYKYTARYPKTKELISSTVQAQSEQSAVKVITDQGLMPTSVELENSNKGFGRNKVGSKDKVIFFRQLATLVSSGLPLAQSLRTVSEQLDSKVLVLALGKIVTDVEGGSTLADAMGRQPHVFNDVQVNLVAAGETSGTLDETLQRIATQTEKDAEMISKVRGALVYPVIVLLVIVGVVIFMLTTVLPQIELLYDDLGQTLPFMTAMLLVVANAIINYWWLILMLLAASVYFARRYIQTEGGRRQFDVFKMSMPLFGPLFKKLYMARFTRTGSTLLRSGVQMLEMLRVTSQSVGNVMVARDIMRAADKVRGGKTLSSSLEASDYFLSLVPQMINIGEQSGSIDGMMSKAADFFEKELDDQIKTISTVIEPVLMIVLAAVAAIMVGAILLPVYGLVGENIAL